MFKNKITWIEIIIVLLIGTLLISKLYTVLKEIDKKESISYSLNKDEKEYYEIGYGDYDLKMIPRESGILKYNILLQEIGGDVSGEIGYAVRTVDGKNELTNGLWNSASMRLTGAIEVSLNGIELEAGKEYVIRLYSRISGNVKIALDEEGEPYNKQIYENAYVKNHYIFVVIILIIALISGSIIFILNKKFDYFFIFSMLIGGVMIFVMPPCTAPDEFRHFLRAYTISEGVITCKDYTSNEKYYYQTLAECEIPKDIFNIKLLSENSAELWTSETNSLIFYPEYIRQLTDDFFDKEDRIIVPYHGVSSISPIAYIPQVFGICVAKLLNFNALWTFYMARLGNLLCSTWLVYCAQRICKRYKELFVILFFIPGLFFLRSSCSTDGVLFGLITLLTAYLLEINSNKEKSFCSVAVYIKTVLLLSLIALIKLPYVLLVSILLFFNINKFGIYSSKKNILNRIKQVLFWGSAIGLSCIVYLLSNMFLSRFSISTSTGTYIGYILKHPMEIIVLLTDTFFDNFVDYMQSAFCFPHGKSYFIIYIFIIVYFGFNKRESADEKNRIAYFMLVGIAMWMAILGVFYLIGPSAELGYIWGIQGRYLLPIFPVLGIGLSNCNIIEADENRIIGKHYYLYIILILTTYILNTYSLYWL